MDKPQAGMALCLSGGGFRALHWHLGSLRALNARGLLARLDSISGVSAGALAAAWLGLCWARLDFDAQGRARRLDSEVLEPLRAFAQRRIGVAASVLSLLPVAGLPARMLAGELDRLLYRGAVLGDQRACPDTLLSALDLDTAEQLCFNPRGISHALHGRLERPELALAQAVAASCAFPPFFAPARLPLPDAGYSATWSGGELLRLADGVLQDNLALDGVWPSHRVLLVSDASLPRKLPSPLSGVWHSVLLHGQRSQFHQARLTRLTRLREQFAHGLRRGAWWGLAGEWFSSEAPAGSELPGKPALQQALAERGQVAASLLRLPEATQRLLEDAAEALAAAACAAVLR